MRGDRKILCHVIHKLYCLCRASNSLPHAIVTASLGSAKQVFVVEGGASGGASVSGGTLYDVESVAADGRAVRSRVLHMPDDTIVVKSVQTD